MQSPSQQKEHLRKACWPGAAYGGSLYRFGTGGAPVPLSFQGFWCFGFAVTPFGGFGGSGISALICIVYKLLCSDGRHCFTGWWLRCLEEAPWHFDRIYQVFRLGSLGQNSFSVLYWACSVGLFSQERLAR